MQYQWDENKRMADTAIETIDDRYDYGETRWVTIGFINRKLHVMVYTIRRNSIRIISLRKANRRESHYYEEKQ